MGISHFCFFTVGSEQLNLDKLTMHVKDNFSAQPFVFMFQKHMFTCKMIKIPLVIFKYLKGLTYYHYYLKH